MSNMPFHLPSGVLGYPNVSDVFAYMNTNSSIFGDADATLLASRVSTISTYSPDESELQAVDPRTSSPDDTPDSQPLEAVSPVTFPSDASSSAADENLHHEEPYSQAMHTPTIPPPNGTSIVEQQFRWQEYLPDEGASPTPQNAFTINATNPYAFTSSVAHKYESRFPPQSLPPARTPASSSVQLAPVGPNQAPNNFTLGATLDLNKGMTQNAVGGRKRKNDTILEYPGKTKHQKTPSTATTSTSTAYQMLPPPLPLTRNAQATSTTPRPVTESMRTVTIISVAGIPGYPPDTFIIPYQSRAAFWVTKFLTADDIFFGKISQKVYLIKCKPKATGSQDPVENFAVFQADMDPKNAISVDVLRPYRCATQRLANKEETAAYWQRVLDIKAAMRVPDGLR